MSTFKDNVLKIVCSIPRGKVMSYGQVSLVAGFPRGARQVGWVLHGMSAEFAEKLKVPWWRIINSAGMISVKGHDRHDADVQKKLLEQEDVFVDKGYKVDMNKYRFIPDFTELE